MQLTSNTIEVTKEAREDIKARGEYLYRAYGYVSLVDNFNKKISKAIKALEYFPHAYIDTGIKHKGNPVYYKATNKNIIVYAISDEERRVYILRVLSERIQWYKILKRFQEG